MATFNGDPGLTREELESIRAPVEEALTLPARTFASDAFFDLEVKRIFHRHWMALCFEATLPNPGDMRPIELFGQPLAGAGPWRRRNPAGLSQHLSLRRLPRGAHRAAGGDGDRGACAAER